MAFQRSGKRDFNGGGARRNDRGGGRSFGDRGPRGGGELQLFDVVCAECGKETQVPFKPTGERPVLCRDCFKGGDSRGNDRRAPSGGGNANELREINEKLDRILEILEHE
jgi:CxxC-x17-CxxC domain-containing protein